MLYVFAGMYIFTHALYFKGAWRGTFNPYLTEDYDFHFLNGDSIRVPFMTTYFKNRFISVFDGFKVLKLLYKPSRTQYSNDRSFHMCIFLPDAKDGLPALLEKAGSESDFVNRHVPNEIVEVGKFRIPKI
ncbi:Serpin-zxa [Heracleum sosnowskyi]|uniref:Serpin-zxa n=1 Tax=Heracleum sosnowskyi TaxID=360622 RepID=A0AAD8J115_9APIA|nr:Serpin-zxa [Heracleum sosnowskyi]